MSKCDDDNRSNQLNPNNDAYWSSRGMDRPSGDDEDFGEGCSVPADRFFRGYFSSVSAQSVTSVPVLLDFILLSGRTVHLQLDVEFPGYAVSNQNGEEALEVIENLYDYIAASTAAHYGEVVAWGEVRDCNGTQVSWLGSKAGFPDFGWPSHDAYTQRAQIKVEWAAREHAAVAQLHSELAVGAPAITRTTIARVRPSAARSRRDRVPLQFDATPA